MAEDGKQFGKAMVDLFKGFGRSAGEAFKKGFSEKGDMKGEQKALYQSLLDSEESFLKEKERLADEAEAAAEAKAQRSFQLKLMRAKSWSTQETARINESYRQQKKLSDAYEAELEASLKAIQAEIKRFKEQIVLDFDDIAKRGSKTLEELTKSRLKMEEKMIDYGGLFRHRTLTFVNAGKNGSKEVYEQYLPDLRKKRQELEAYAGLIRTVSELEEVPSELFYGIRDLPIKDAIGFQEALLALNEEERQKYVSDWQAIQELSKETASDSYAEQVAGAISVIESELAEWYGTIPDGFFTEGELSAEAFGVAFVNKIHNLEDQMAEAVLSVLPKVVVMGDILPSNVGQETVRQVSNNTTYVLNSAGETVSQQLRSAAAYAEIAKMRGDFSGNDF